MKLILCIFSLVLPFLSHAHDKQIIGSDDRYQIMGLDYDPLYSTVGMIEYADRKGSYCTGTLIAPKFVITNGHCVVRGNGLPVVLYEAELVKFTPGRLIDGGSPYGSYQGVAIHTFPEWINERKPEFDVALIELDTEVMEPVVEVERFSGKEVEGPIYVTGYSAWKPTGSMWEGQGSFIRVLDNGQQFHHTADTQPGTSGAMIRRWVNHGWRGIGIHRGTGYPVPNVNTGILFNDRVYKAIHSLVKEQK